MVLCLSTFDIPLNGFETIEALDIWRERLDDLLWDDYTAASVKLLDAYGLDVDDATEDLGDLEAIF